MTEEALFEPVDYVIKDGMKYFDGEPEVYREFSLIPNPRIANRKEIAEDVEAFIRAGGEIKQCRAPSEGARFPGDPIIKRTEIDLDDFGFGLEDEDE